MGRFFGGYSERLDPEGRGRVERGGVSAGVWTRRQPRGVSEVFAEKEDVARVWLPEVAWRRCDVGGWRGALSENLGPIECRAGRTPLRLNHVFLFAVWGGPGEWGGDVGEAVRSRPGQTCGEPSARVFGDGSCQPRAARLRAGISWLPGEDSNFPVGWNQAPSDRTTGRRDTSQPCTAPSSPGPQLCRPGMCLWTSSSRRSVHPRPPPA